MPNSHSEENTTVACFEKMPVIVDQLPRDFFCYLETPTYVCLCRIAILFHKIFDLAVLNGFFICRHFVFNTTEL